jgi:hypothetical protein
VYCGQRYFVTLYPRRKRRGKERHVEDRQPNTPSETLDLYSDAEIAQTVCRYLSQQEVQYLVLRFVVERNQAIVASALGVTLAFLRSFEKRILQKFRLAEEKLSRCRAERLSL